MNYLKIAWLTKFLSSILLVTISLLGKAQDTTCCKTPDSLKVVSVSTTQFCVSWIIKPVTPPCDSVVSSTIRYRKVGLDAWTTQTITLTNVQFSVLFCTSAEPCTQYEWEVKNNCKRSDSVVVSSAWVTGPNFTTPCDTSSCCTPDSLKLVSLTANSFCVSWKISDSANCDSAIGAVIQFRPVGFRFWKAVTISYILGTTTYTYCDSILPCTAYEWQVKTICRKNGVISYSPFLSGPSFTSPCFRSAITSLVKSKLLQFDITPNPASDKLLISIPSTNSKTIIISITDGTGRVVYLQKYNLLPKSTTFKIDVSNFAPVFYFIKVQTETGSLTKGFLKK